MGSAVGMGSAGTASSLDNNRVESSSTGGGRPRPVRERLVATLATSLFLCAFLASCSGFFIKPTVSSIFITPSAATVGVGQMTTLAAYATYSDGTQNQISGNSVGWSSSATNIASVSSPGGAVTGVALGTATITASSQGVSGTATVNVTISNITSLVITTTQGSTQPITTATINGTTGTLQFYAYANGSPNNDVTQSVTWTSSNTSVATIASGGTSGNGLASAVAAGTTNITATTTNTTTGQQVSSQTIVLTVTS
jgi:trimeric autotransporter adhesin